MVNPGDPDGCPVVHVKGHRFIILIQTGDRSQIISVDGSLIENNDRELVEMNKRRNRKLPKRFFSRAAIRHLLHQILSGNMIGGASRRQEGGKQ